MQLSKWKTCWSLNLHWQAVNPNMDQAHHKTQAKQQRRKELKESWSLKDCRLLGSYKDLQEEFTNSLLFRNHMSPHAVLKQRPVVWLFKSQLGGVKL